ACVPRSAAAKEAGARRGPAPPDFLRGIRTVSPGRGPNARPELARLLGRGRRRRPRERARLVAELTTSASLELERDELECTATLLSLRLVVRPVEQTQCALEPRELLSRYRAAGAPVFAHASQNDRDRHRDERERNDEEEPEQSARRQRVRTSGRCEICVVEEGLELRLRLVDARHGLDGRPLQQDRLHGRTSLDVHLRRRELRRAASRRLCTARRSRDRRKDLHALAREA